MRLTVAGNPFPNASTVDGKGSVGTQNASFFCAAADRCVDQRGGKFIFGGYVGAGKPGTLIGEDQKIVVIGLGIFYQAMTVSYLENRVFGDIERACVRVDLLHKGAVLRTDVGGADHRGGVGT